MKHTTGNFRTRKARKQSTPSYRRNARGVNANQHVTLKAIEPDNIGIGAYIAAAIAPLLSRFTGRRGD